MIEMNENLVSVIMPLYNCESFIEASIESVLAQTYENYELILVDDCSLDRSFLIARQYAEKDNRVKAVRMSDNSGAAVSRNRAIELANGRYIVFLDSDDLWSSDKLERQIDFMRKNDVAFSYSAYEKIDENGVSLGVIGVPEQVSYTDLLKVCSVGCLTAIYDTEKLGKVYMPLIRKRQDLGLWLRILKRIPYGYATPGVLAQYRIRKDSISANKVVAAQYTWKLYREFEKLSLIKASYYFSHYAVNGILRTKFPKLAKFLGVLK